MIEYDEDFKQVMAKNTDKLYCVECHSVLEEVEEPMVRIKHYNCNVCGREIVCKAY